MLLDSIVFLDHYDSFSRNLIELIRLVAPGIKIERIFCDDAAGLQQLVNEPKPLVISPGPKSPQDLPLVIESVASVLGRAPILGVCLGHQILGFLHGSKILALENPHHGATIHISLDVIDPMFVGLPSEITVATYNSLVISPPIQGKILATAIKDGSIQSVRYSYAYPTYGVQFHPESYLTMAGATIVKNWFALCRDSQFDDLCNQVDIGKATIFS
jgi:anthranilate synthase/aminodeoxychorismate synthase-like glutamine amidotransferase